MAPALHVTRGKFLKQFYVSPKSLASEENALFLLFPFFFSVPVFCVALFLFCSGMINVSLAHGLEANRWIMHRVPELWIVHGGTVRWLGSPLFPPLLSTCQRRVYGYDWRRTLFHHSDVVWPSRTSSVHSLLLYCVKEPQWLCDLVSLPQAINSNTFSSWTEWDLVITPSVFLHNI